MSDLAFVLLVLLGVLLMVLVTSLSGDMTDPDDEPIDEELEQARIMQRYYDDPDFIKDMGLTPEEQEHLNR
jgi:hypothetical protein